MDPPDDFIITTTRGIKYNMAKWTKFGNTRKGTYDDYHTLCGSEKNKEGAYLCMHYQLFEALINPSNAVHFLPQVSCYKHSHILCFFFN